MLRRGVLKIVVWLLDAKVTTAALIVIAVPIVAEAGPSAEQVKTGGEIILGLIGLTGAIVSIIRARNERLTQQLQRAESGSSVNVLRVTSEETVPQFSSKRPVIKYLKLAFLGLISVLLSLGCVLVISAMRLRQNEALAEARYLKVRQQIEQLHMAAEAAGAQQVLGVMPDRKELDEEIAAGNTRLLTREIIYSVAAVLFFLFGFLQLRTFKGWLWSRPFDLNCPSRACQRVEVTAALSLADAVGRSLTAVKKAGGQIIQFDAEAKPCVLRAVKNYKGPSSYFEHIEIHISEVNSNSTITIRVDGLRPTPRSDRVRNQFILNSLLNDITA